MGYSFFLFFMNRCILPSVSEIGSVFAEHGLPQSGESQEPAAKKCWRGRRSLSLCQQSDSRTPKELHQVFPLIKSARRKIYQCDFGSCHYRRNVKSNLIRHQRAHLPAEQRIKSKIYQCDHNQCSFKTERKNYIQIHQQTHLPRDQRFKEGGLIKMYKCDHNQCNFMARFRSNV